MKKKSKPKHVNVNEQTVEAVKWWQNNEKVHPLTCPRHSMASLIVKEHKGKVVLFCRYCKYRQDHIPNTISESHLLSKIFGE